MWGRATSSPPLTVAVLAALWLGVGRCDASGAPGPGCDNGKLSLDTDLPAASLQWACPVSTWMESVQRRPGIDTVYDPEPARLVCMNKPISYHHDIPNSGAYRPVRAESGEYLYCPPQRWLNNLHHGAAVLLYHPCAPLHLRHSLSALASSCLSEYIITPHPRLSPHMPIALVSWGRTLELATVTSEVCDWLETLTTTSGDLSGVTHIRKYNLLLTRRAKLQQPLYAHPQEHSAHMQDSVRQCCEQTIASLLSEAVEAELEPRRRSSSKSLTKMEEEGKSRQIRAAIRETQPGSETGDIQHNNNTTLRPSQESPPGNRTLSDSPGSSEALLPSNIQHLNQSHTAGRSTPLGSNTSEVTSDSLELKTSHSEKSSRTIQTETLQLASKHTEATNTEPSQTERPEALGPSPRHEGTDSAEHSGKQNDPKGKKYIAADGKLRGNEVVEVKERELEQKQTHRTPHSHHKSENNGFDAISKTQSASPPLGLGSERAAVNLPNSHDCDGCRAGEHCDCTRAPPADLQAKGLPRTPRTDEAVWAAAALGFLLVLLTLSVLHSRLYRHWRTAPSLYWHDPRQDYDSVADVIRRRLRIAKRRRKRGRRKECVLLPSSSSSDELA